MPSFGEEDREAVDRAFAELVAGFHLTAERPDTIEAETPGPETPGVPDQPTATWAEDHPLFAFEPSEPVRRAEPAADPAEDRFVPSPPPPLPKPAWPALLGWLGMGYAVLIVLAAVVGIRLPGWAGWAAIIGFVGGFAVLVLRLPRQRPPDAGDGAVL